MQFAVSHFNIPEEVIVGKSRKREYIIPRFWVAAKALEETSMSLVKIGKALGGRDHSTIMHAASIYRCEMESQSRTKFKQEFAKANFAWEVLKAEA